MVSEATSSSPRALEIENSSSNKNDEKDRPSAKRKLLAKLPTYDIEKK